MRVRAVLFWSLLVLLLLPAAVVTLVRLVEPDAGRALQLQAFTPFAMPLYALALLLLLVPVVRRRGERRRFVVPALLVAAALSLHGWWFSPQVLGEGRPIADGAEETVVMAANLYLGEGDAVELLGQASERDVDVLVVSEITANNVIDMQRAGLTDVFPHSAGRPGGYNEGTMIFSREEIENVEVLDLPFFNLVVDTGGLTVAGLHPRAPTDPQGWRLDHAEILRAAEQLEPDLIAGDLNAAPDHAPIRALDDAGYRDTAELLNKVFLPTWPVNGIYFPLSLFPPTVQIDHVLINDSLGVSATDTVSIPGTDHRPIVATVGPR